MFRTADVKYDLRHRSRTEEETMEGLDRRALYGISVTSELTGVNPQNLRVYESRGLIEPQRTSGGTRRYSEHDVARINRIAGLLDDGLNLKGIAHVLELEAETQRLRQEVQRLRELHQRSTKRSGERGK
jgi:MerR family transcriptional regulator, heat shock protein HspR